MSVTTAPPDLATATRAAWELAIRDTEPMLPTVAIDWLRDQVYCEPDAALAAMRTAAADWLREKKPGNTLWYHVPLGVLAEITASMEVGYCAARIREYTARIRKLSERWPESREAHDWLPWCDLAERAVAVLSEMEGK